jgi:hypothetical protein
MSPCGKGRDRLYASENMEPSKPRATEPSALDRRKHPRKSGLWNARLDTATGAFACNVLNISKGGAMLFVTAPVAAKQEVALEIGRRGALEAEVVWRLPDKNKIGLRFTVGPETVAAVLNDVLPPDAPTDLELGI